MPSIIDSIKRGKAWTFSSLLMAKYSQILRKSRCVDSAVDENMPPSDKCGEYLLMAGAIGKAFPLS